MTAILTLDLTLEEAKSLPRLLTYSPPTPA